MTGEVLLDQDGMPQTEEVEIKIPAFRAVSVFDISQTDGEPIPELEAKELLSTVEGYEDFIRAITYVAPAPISFEDIPGDSKGYFRPTENRIVVQKGMSESQTLKTMVHETAHSMLHSKEADIEDIFAPAKDRNTKEVEAESIAYTVCQHFGIDTSDYSFGYIAGWSSGKEMPELKSSLDIIRRTASELITGIEGQLQELQRDREMMQGQEKESLLLIQNSDLSEYSLVNVRGMDAAEVVEALYAMNDGDRLSVASYLESRGAWTMEIANQDTKEFEEYHLDVRYITDINDVIDLKVEMELNERAKEPIGVDDVILKITHSNGFEVERITNKTPEEVQEIMAALVKLEEKDRKNIHDCLESCGADYIPIIVEGGRNSGMPQFNDFEIDLVKKNVFMMHHRSPIQQAEGIINRLEFAKAAFSDDERNLIVNYAYKLNDMEKTRELAEHIYYEETEGNQGAAFAVIDAQAEIDALPDPKIGLSEMEEYGYTWNEMLPLTKDRASELFGEGLEVYSLHPDGSETVIKDWGALQGHDGLFGVEKDDWGAYLGRESEERIPGREMRPLSGNKNWFGIYQLKDTEETRDIRFMNMNYLEKKDIQVSGENYTLVYSGELEEGMSLEDIYTKFNIDRPSDFTGHSLSVSDVVVLHQGGKTTSHYVDSIGYREVPGFTKEIERSAEIGGGETPVIDEAGEAVKGSGQEEPDMDKVSYYVIEDLSTWAENSPEKSKLERFDSLPEAIEKFAEYKGKDMEDKSDMARATLGVSVNGIELDVIHVRNHENCLSLDFTHSRTVGENSRFLDDLQVLYNEVGFDKVRVHREMSPEEVKDFVKQRFEYQLKNSGLEDVSLYMDRFDTLYEQGKMEHLMPTANQKHIVEDVPFMEWENSWEEIRERKKVADCEAKTEGLINGIGERIQEEKKADRVSVKEKLVEKKAIIEQRNRADKKVTEKGTEKKSEREI